MLNVTSASAFIGGGLGIPSVLAGVALISIGEVSSKDVDTAPRGGGSMSMGWGGFWLGF